VKLAGQQRLDETVKTFETLQMYSTTPVIFAKIIYQSIKTYFI